MQLPVNENASKGARKLLAFLEEQAGHRIITGQHTQTVPMEEISYIKEVTGKEPKLRGFELLGYSPNINYQDAGKECLTEVEENKGTLQEAMRFAMESDGILTFTFHWFSPLGGGDKSFYSENTDFDPERVLLPESRERDAFFHDLDRIAELLLPFAEKDIPILWRPFHEADGEWFWWGRKGAKVAGELFKLMYDRFVEKFQLDNLLWVWNGGTAEGYPGDDYVDVVSIDVYFETYRKTDYREEYEALVQATSRNKVAALAEVGLLPDMEMMERSKVPFAYFMVWSKEFCIGEKHNSVENLKKVYQSPYVVTL